MEVIARKSGSYAGYTALCFIVGVAAIFGCIIGMIAIPEVWYVFLALLLIPAICFPVGIYCLKKSKLPNNLITLDGEKLIIHDGRTLLLSQIRNVSYKHASSKYGSYKFGSISLNLVNGEVIKIYPVADLDAVGTRLSQLIYGKTK